MYNGINNTETRPNEQYESQDITETPAIEAVTDTHEESQIGHEISGLIFRLNEIFERDYSTPLFMLPPGYHIYTSKIIDICGIDERIKFEELVQSLSIIIDFLNQNGLRELIIERVNDTDREQEIKNRLERLGYKILENDDPLYDLLGLENDAERYTFIQTQPIGSISVLEIFLDEFFGSNYDSNVISELKLVRSFRNTCSYIHWKLRDEKHAIFQRIGEEYPCKNYKKAWTKLLTKYKNCLEYLLELFSKE